MARRSGAATPSASSVSEAPQEATPRAIRLLRAHGFIDEDGCRHQWRAGIVVTSPDEIALLMTRRAVVAIVE